MGAHREEVLDVTTCDVQLGDDPTAPADLLDRPEGAVRELDRQAVGGWLVPFGGRPADVLRRGPGERHARVELDERLPFDRRGVEDGMRAARDPCADVAADAGHDPVAICSASANRTSTWASTASREHAQIESWAESSMTRRHASSRRRAGQVAPWRAASGSANRSSEALGPPGGLLDVGAVARDAHQHVGPGSGAELAVPVGEAGRVGGILGGRPDVVRQRADDDVDRIARRIDRVDEVAVVVLRERVVLAVHREDRPVAEDRLAAPDVAGDPLPDDRRVRDHEQVAGVAVPAEQVLGADRGPVRGDPAERVAVDRLGDAAPHDGVADPGPAQDLGHLGDVAEHVRQVADRHRPAELLGAAGAGFQVAHDRLARDEELVHEDEPRADGQAPAADEGAHAAPRARAGPRGSRRRSRAGRRA